ncbi:MAG: preQ(1) synthase [Neisseriaceae bacterium]
MEVNNNLQALTLLGTSGVPYPKEYDPTILEVFTNPHPERDYWVCLSCLEFTTLCPKTGQPDFAKLYIAYVPQLKMVESKSLKLYLGSYRNHGGFHEDCMNLILKDLKQILEPKYIEILGLFSPRGGIAIYPYVNDANEEDQWQILRKKRFTEFNLNHYINKVS